MAKIHNDGPVCYGSIGFEHDGFRWICEEFNVEAETNAFKRYLNGSPSATGFGPMQIEVSGRQWWCSDFSSDMAENVFSKTFKEKAMAV